MDQSLPGLILTGASGFVGRNFIKAAMGRFRLFCIARRSIEEAGVQPEDNLRWIQVDIADRDKVLGMAQRLRDYGGVEYVVNLAGYYDFTNEEHVEYVRTNVGGTRNMLDLAKELGVKRFIFASSQAACSFGTLVSEETPAEATIPYARSKQAGEVLVREYAQWVPGAIIRIAAVFSDWCEYPPLYTMLNNWCSGKFIESHIIAGRGQSAIPYVHVHDLVQLFLQVIAKSPNLDRLCTFNGGPDGTVTHLELYRIATQFYYNKSLKPFFTPGWLLGPMILIRRMLSQLQHKEPFERLWMVRYIDQQLIADSSWTRRELSWKPTPRKSIKRRLVFLIENMKKNPDLWRSWNEAMLHKHANRPHLVLHDMLCDAMEEDREAVVQITRQLLVGDTVVHGRKTAELDFEPSQDQSCLQAMRDMEQTVANSFIRLLCQLIITILRTRNRPMMQQYAHAIAFLPTTEGFDNGLVSRCLFLLGEVLIQRFRGQAKFRQLTPQADDYIIMAIHMAIDRLEDYRELSRVQSQVILEELKKIPPPEDNRQLEKIVTQLEKLSCEAQSGQSWSSPSVKA